MKIYKQKNKIIVEINKFQDAIDAIGEKVGEIDNIIGVACKDEDGNEEIGFSYLLDRTYKDAEPDISTTFLFVNLEKGEFIKLCQELGISFFEYPICGICGKSIFGSFSQDEKGRNLCWECEQKLNHGSK